MSETKAVETLDEQIEALRAQRRTQKLAEEQREKLLPALEEKVKRLDVQISALSQEQKRALEAIACIYAGRPTDYRLRAKPRKRATGGEEE